MAQRIYKTPIAQAQKLVNKQAAIPSFFDFANDPTGDLLYKWVRSSGWGATGNPINKNSYMLETPDDGSYRVTRQQLIDELNERKRIDDEEDGDWFDFAKEEGYDFHNEPDYKEFGELNDFRADENWGQFKKRKGWK